MAESGKGRELLEIIQKALIQADSGELEIADKYTRRVVQPLSEKRDETTIRTLGDLPGIPLTGDLIELLNLWQRLDRNEQAAILKILRASMPKS